MVEVYGYSIATIPAVCAVVYGIIEFLKYFVFDAQKVGKFIPLIASGIGAVLTLVAFLFFPDIVPVSSWYSAILIGAASGLSAVGVNQIKKQMGSDSNDS